MASTTWNLDTAHSEVTFKVKHLVISTVSGNFKNFSSAVSTEGDDFSTAKISFELETGSLDTGSDMRNDHLRGDDFFNADAFPKITFKATSIRHLDGADHDNRVADRGLEVRLFGEVDVISEADKLSIAPHDTICKTNLNRKEKRVNNQQ